MKTLKGGQNTKIHLGCGLKTPQGWVNVDGSWNAWLAKYPKFKRLLKHLHLIPEKYFDIPWNPDIVIYDVRRCLPFPDNSAEAVYASHLLEHLYLDEEEFLLRECFRVLCPGGTLRVVVPDLKAIIEEYMREWEPEGGKKINHCRAAERLNQRLLLRDISAPKGSIYFRLYCLLKDYHLHKYMHDVNSLRVLFEKTGFREVAEMNYLQSRIGNIGDIEEKECLAKGAGVCVEGVKPGKVQKN